MRESDADKLLRKYTTGNSFFSARRPTRHRLIWAGAVGALSAITVGAGIITGWYLHNTYWRQAEFDYTLSRAAGQLAYCKGISRSELMRNIEDHIARPSRLFQLDDKLVALDFIFDRIEARGCITIQARTPAPSIASRRNSG
ncbi:hypothetical protein PZ897_02205 [Hoeflea sp. YIM 152468]|uniref:hypothetical protein n=1 Tax=Hoeflea sp. YIM 152468 TaxID=3031759 RepID=UPI0023DC6E46|nr:hypothetical protein [Hoeflea sp. YIM 152468]MDF1606983.1 hypothetical protein [Hoeflea sp. YIM 152468]